MTEEFKLTPKVTSSMANSVSQYRREMLEKQTQSGLFREPGSTGSSYNELKSTAAGYVVGTHGKINKTASQGWSGSGGTVRQAPEIYSPLWLNSNLNMPRDRATINSWSRAYYATNPMVHNAISLHSTYPISKLSIKCKHPKIEKFFSEQIEELDLMNICCQIAQEYWTLGEAFPYAQLDDRAAKWSQIIIQNPDYIVVNQSVAAMDPLISLRPDENLKRIVSGNKASDIQQRQKLDKNIVDHVKKNENIPLDNLNISHLARKISPYETRGTGLTVTIFKQLMLWDQLRECKYAQAANMINPLTLVKVGGGSGDYKPTPADLESWRDVFENAQYDKDFKIITHEAVTVERIGANSGILDTSNDFTQLMKEIYIGLMVPPVLMDGGADTSYANGGVALDVLRQRYMQFRNKLSAWLRRKIFAPIAMMNEFYDYEEHEKVLIVPEIDWNHMSLFDAGDYIATLLQLSDPQSKRVSVQSLYRSLGLDWEDESRKIKVEIIQEAIVEKEKQALSQMNLNELRALGPNDEIVEPAFSPLPGEETQAASEEDNSQLPGVAMPGPGAPGPSPGPTAGP